MRQKTCLMAVGRLLRGFAVSAAAWGVVCQTCLGFLVFGVFGNRGCRMTSETL
jgi:hypothetical protein